MSQGNDESSCIELEASEEAKIDLLEKLVTAGDLAFISGCVCAGYLRSPAEGLHVDGAV